MGLHVNSIKMFTSAHSSGIPSSGSLVLLSAPHVTAAPSLPCPGLCGQLGESYKHTQGEGKTGQHGEKRCAW